MSPEKYEIFTQPLCLLSISFDFSDLFNHRYDFLFLLLRGNAANLSSRASSRVREVVASISAFLL